MLLKTCCLCDREVNPQTDCELVCFSLDEHDKQWQSLESAKSVPAKNTNCDWFCRFHLHTAQAFAHLNIQNAMHHIRANECWNLRYIDLFDPDTPPSIVKSGVGFETGFVELWDSILKTVEITGVKHPLTYRLSFNGGQQDYEPLRWPINEVLKVKQFLSTRSDSVRLQEQIGLLQAREMRQHGAKGPVQWMTALCVQLDEQDEPGLLTPGHK